MRRVDNRECAFGRGGCDTTVVKVGHEECPQQHRALWGLYPGKYRADVDCRPRFGLDAGYHAVDRRGDGNLHFIDSRIMISSSARTVSPTATSTCQILALISAVTIAMGVSL